MPGNRTGLPTRLVGERATDQNFHDTAVALRELRQSVVELERLVTALQAQSTEPSDGDKGDITVSGSGLVWNIDAGAVGNTELADMPDGTLKGNDSGAPAAPQNLTGTEVTALLDVFTDTDQGVVPASGGDATEFLCADGTFKDPLATFTSGWYGDGSDGTVNIGAGTTTLARDMYYEDLTVPASGVLQTNGFRIHVRGTLTVEATGRIEHDGTAGTAGGSGGFGGAGAVSGTLRGGGAGGAGGIINGSNGSAWSAAVPSFPGAGGTGGSGGGRVGGNGGIITSVTATQGNIRSIVSAYTGGAWGVSGGTFTALMVGGGPGGGGGAGSGTISGGGGGGGGGYMVIAAAQASISGTIRTRGGDGGQGVASNTSGGGGGSGGTTIVICDNYSGNAPTAPGGTGGAGNGTGGQGNNGVAGLVLQLSVR